MKRRSFLKQAGGIVGAAAMSSPTMSSPAIAQTTQPKIKWRLASSYPRTLATLFGASVRFAQYVKACSGGEFEIEVFAPGEIVPPMQVMDAVSNGTVQCGHTSGYYYFGKNPAYCFDTTVPFGLTARQMTAWLTEGNGTKLLRELFDKANIVNFALGNTGVQMGGWFRKEIKALDDLKGVKMRVAGLSGELMARLGVVPQQIAGGDIYPALEKGTLDAVEYVGPVDDEKLGFHKVAKYYYYPGFFEAGPVLSLYINKDEYYRLPKHFQAMIDTAVQRASQEMLAMYDANNAAALKRLIAGGAVFRSFSQDILEEAFKHSQQMYQTYCDKYPQFKTVYESYMAFRDDVTAWFNTIEGNYVRFVSYSINQQRKANANSGS